MLIYYLSTDFQDERSSLLYWETDVPNFDQNIVIFTIVSLTSNVYRSEVAVKGGGYSLAGGSCFKSAMSVGL